MNLGFRHDVQTLKWARSTTFWLAVFLSLGSMPRAVRAQDMSFDIDEAESAGGAAKDKGKSKGKPAAKEKEAPAEETSAEAGGGGDVLTELTAGGSKKEAEPTEGGLPREKEIAEKIYAVQRMYVLRRGRFEVAPSLAFTVNDQFVTHNALAGSLNYWVTNVLAVGANVLWHQGLESESALDFTVRRSTRLAVPITEYQLGANLNFTYVPVYGKFELFNDSIFQWDSYIVGGVGVIRTRPVAEIDPSVRTFSFDWRVSFNAGIGLRVFMTRWLSVFGELRDYMYLEKLENLKVALGSGTPGSRTDTATWIDPSSTLTHNVMMHVGITMFFPFTFEYRYPK